MSLSTLGNLLESVPQYQRLRKSLERKPASVRVQVISDAAPFALSTLWDNLRVPTLIVAPRPEDARRLYEQMVIWSGRPESVLHFPEAETLPFERLVSDEDTTHERLRTLSTLADRGAQPSLVVASTSAIAQKTIDIGAFESSRHTLHKGERIDLDEILDLWRRIGYKFEPAVDAPGLVNRRGGIIDVFPVGSPLPARIELWGDDIDSIRLFDPATQRTTQMTDSITIIPAQETMPTLSEGDTLAGLLDSIDMSTCSEATGKRLSEELDLILDGHVVEDLSFYAGYFNRGSLLEYFPENGVLVMYRPSDIHEAASAADERAHQLRSVKERRGELPLRFPSPHLLWSEVQERTRHIRRRVEVTPWGADDLTHQDTYVLPFTSAPGYLGEPGRFAREAAEMASEGHRVIAVTSVPNRLSEILKEHGVDAALLESLDEAPEPGAIALLQTSGAGLKEGFVMSVGGRNLVVLSDSEIFGVAKQRGGTRRRAVRQDAFLSELSPGDYVVHVEHGIGRFEGTGKASRDEGEREYLIVRYAQGDKLYVPMDHLDRVSPYIAPMDRPPTLTRLGSQEWQRTRERVARSTTEMAAELLSLYSVRELAEGNAFGEDTPWQTELEDSFPYEETPDQKTTIADVKSDMESGRPMDRLVCGDVGYGKTEVALRAAFKAVMSGKQVAILVPTTVLAQQHYATFSQRLAAYPVVVEVLSRFRTDIEQRQVVEGLASGRVDICIGTHRLIQKDVRFKDLGLIVIDEEQRFGVAHKEKLKQMRHEVDVLTLTATPIPRTLHLSLAGVRDMSTIETPPEERLPIKTYVSEFSDELFIEAIRREIDRQGQVFFLHNRVYNIDYMAGYIRSLVPEARVGVAHGQMPEEQLEQAMIDFADGKMDVLTCTTIIESGLDIPNVNTLIIDRADTFGLAQLYQLRGRVGRGSRRAYAYLLIPPARSLTETAEKRLKTMLAATELGAGFRIAMKDLEIRGAGNILGAEQSGHIHAVGFDLYTKMLNEAVEGLRARRAAGLSEDSAPSPGEQDGDGPLTDYISGAEAPASVELGIPANIPEQYIADLSLRLGIYRKLVRISSLGEVSSMEDELLDRFGPLPWQVQNLLYVVRLKLLAGKAGMRSIHREEGSLVLRLHGDVGGAMQALRRLLGRGIVVGHTQIRLDLAKLADGWEGPLKETVEKLAEFRERLAAQLEEGGHGI
jgi:transcription-repair coupling factor (superfamily II helicase)